MKSCEEQFTMYNATIQGLLDTFLPIKSIKICHSDKPWVTTQYIELIRQRQQALLQQPSHYDELCLVLNTDL